MSQREDDAMPPDDATSDATDDWDGTPGPTSGGPIAYFRDRPARFFGVLGTIVFVAGWAGVVYLAFFANDFQFGPSETFYRVQIALSLGASVTLAAGVLWAIAAYLWVQLVAPDEQLARS